VYLPVEVHWLFAMGRQTREEKMTRVEKGKLRRTGSYIPKSPYDGFAYIGIEKKLEKGDRHGALYEIQCHPAEYMTKSVDDMPPLTADFVRHYQDGSLRMPPGRRPVFDDLRFVRLVLAKYEYPKFLSFFRNKAKASRYFRMFPPASISTLDEPPHIQAACALALWFGAVWPGISGRHLLNEISKSKSSRI
jgi:hypothetical protein